MKGAKGFICILSLTENPGVTIDGDQLIVAPGEDAVIIHMSTSRKATHTGLKPATKYYVRKFAFNAAGRGPDSAVINMIVV